jgi:hypothetical protein
MRETPYSRLKNAVLRYMSGVDYPRRTVMWLYPKNKLNETWRLGDLAERVSAADQLGFDVKLRMVEDGLRVEYVKRPAPLDYSL